MNIFKDKYHFFILDDIFFNCVFIIVYCVLFFFFFFSSRRRHTRLQGDWSSDVCSSDLFWILTLLPMRVPGITTTFWPRLQRSPITAPGMTWQKCQIFVPRPTCAPSST